MKTGNILDAEFQKPIFYHDGRKWMDVPVVGRVLMVGALFTMPFTVQIFCFPSVALLLGGIALYIDQLYNEKSSYKIYPDAIEIFNEFHPEKTVVLKMEDIESMYYSNVLFVDSLAYLEFTLMKEHEFEGEVSSDYQLKLEITPYELKWNINKIIEVLQRNDIPVKSFEGIRIT